MSLFSIVVPVYHNASSLPDLLSKLQAVADKNPGDDFEFIFVDDGSGDDSFAVLRNLGSDEPRMKVVKLSRNFGSNPAIMAGMSQAQRRCNRRYRRRFARSAHPAARYVGALATGSQSGDCRPTPAPRSLPDVAFFGHLLPALPPLRHQNHARTRLRFFS